MEMMLAFSLMTLFLTSSLALSESMRQLRTQGVRELEDLDKQLPTLSSMKSDYASEWGRDSCSSSFAFNSESIFHNSPVSGTDMEVRDGVAYITSDSNVQNLPDFYIVDMNVPEFPSIISSLNTGPGLSALEIAGHYIYAANAGSTNQLQVIDISDRNSPKLVTTLKLPLPNASSTAPFATAIFYSKGLIYLGTKKWDGKEFSIIDVSVPSSPRYAGGFEIDSQVNDIYVVDGYAYIADSDMAQMRVLDVKNPTDIKQVNSFSPSGWQTQIGEVLAYFEGGLTLGRTTGGFNVTTNHEIFLLSTTSPASQSVIKNSHDIPGGVYGMVLRPPYVYMVTKFPSKEFRIWDMDASEIVFELSLDFSPSALSCDGNNLYII